MDKQKPIKINITLDERCGDDGKLLKHEDNTSDNKHTQKKPNFVKIDKTLYKLVANNTFDPFDPAYLNNSEDYKTHVKQWVEPKGMQDDFVNFIYDNPDAGKIKKSVLIVK